MHNVFSKTFYNLKLGILSFNLLTYIYIIPFKTVRLFKKPIAVLTLFILFIMD